MPKKKREKTAGSKKGRQHSHNVETGRYVRQRARTEANKARRRAKHEARRSKGE